MRITQAIAEKMSEQMTANKKIEAEQAERAFQNLVYKMYDKLTPQSIKRAFIEAPEYLETTNTILIKTNGFHDERVTINGEVISNDASWCSELKVDAETVKPLIALKRAWQKSEEDYKEAQRQIRYALINLRTFKRVETELPAATPFLPKEPTTLAVAINYNKINKLIEAVL